MNLDPDRVLYDVGEVEEIVARLEGALSLLREIRPLFAAFPTLATYALQIDALVDEPQATEHEPLLSRLVRERDAALAKIDDLTCELTAYQVGDSDRSLAGEAEWADVLALRRIEAEDLPASRQIRVRPGPRWLVGDYGLANTLAEALAEHDRAVKS